MRRIQSFILLLLAAYSFTAYAEPPKTFSSAKTYLAKHVYHDRNTVGEAYCGCTWQWNKSGSGGTINAESCGLDLTVIPSRAQRIEWEHIMPAENFGRQLQCWREGGRKNCAANDPKFRAMEADLHNLTPVVGSLNAARSNYRFGMIEGEKREFGACNFEVEKQLRVAEPPESAMGFVARTNLYMASQYGIRLSSQQQKLFEAWNRMYPPSEWELERDRRIKLKMGWGNPYLNYK